MNPGSAPSSVPATRPPGAPPMVRRKKPASDPFFKGPRNNPAGTKPQLNGHLTPPVNVNGHLPPKPQSLNALPPRPSSPSKAVIPDRERVSGFSDPRVAAEGISYTDYKLVTTKRDLLNSLRYHILQLAGDKPIDIRNEAEFPKPVRLHRRDPRAPPPGQEKEKKEEEKPEPKDGLTAAEREDLTRRKEARQKEREANLAQIAPSQNTGKKLNFKKKTQQVFRPDFSAEQKRRIQTNYEEKLPWHLEDFENKHCFIGHHQIGSVSSNAALIYEPSVDASTGKFRLIPIEKVYQFKPKREDLQKMSIEEVEAAMKKGGSDPEWLIRHREARIQEALKERAAKESRALFSGAARTTVDAGRTGEEADLDYEDDFADDEEGDLFVDKDEDEKLAEKRIKEDQLQANFLDFKDLKEYDEAEAREKREAEARKKNFRHMRKALERRERNYNHGSDSEYESSTDSEEERERIERERLANVKKEEEAEAKKSALSSGANTPSGRKEKRGSDREDEGGMKKSTSSRSLKRPGSPNLSDASGTDVSTRKKKIKSRHLPSSQPTPGHSRPMSPVNVLPSSSAPQTLDPLAALKGRKRGGATSPVGAGSDTDTDAAGMSDSSRARRLNLKMSASPPSTGAPGTASPQGQPSSRAASPTPVSAPGSAPRPVAFPSAQDIKNAIPPQGITIRDLMKVVAHPKDKQKDFVALVKEVASYDKERGVLLPK
ncbi:uncharacterized protein A1O5_07225 [Cladophialophora psammophila CBS 110553]|uniref:Uncharacterized protein n=1 Tax=Cladophialophora psammophila CBS 110553 TaxID=1182543 RepID=W9XFN1_9EURO|nr:uncharacterized protein A1O5_07225 [Cladophialophora psammophila CBS 110553]EXJ69189.1 hypothetical protein A1O5_07225 [Cladophialophora psammophila CBS 110553]